MPLPGEPETWKFYSSEIYVPVTYEDEVVGFCKPDFAVRIVDALNDDEKLRKALKLACYDLISRTGGTPSQINELISKYLARTSQPCSGPAAIAALLRDRQDELDVSDREFSLFCDSYRLPVEALEAIYAEDEIDGSLLIPLSRVLGRSVEDLMQVLEGDVEL